MDHDHNHDDLPEPGTNQQGEPYNDLPLGSEDFPAALDPQEALGETWGTDFSVQDAEDAFGHSARPLEQSAADTFRRKFGGR